MNIEKRTNIVLNEKLVDQCIKITGLKTTRAVVEYALKEIVRLHKQSQIRTLKGKISWHGDLDKMRQER